MNPTLPLLDGEPILGHARIGDAIYGVYNGNPHFLRNMPTYEDAPPPYHASMHGNFTSPTYASPATPYIMFIPSVHPWYGPLLNRLNYKRSGLPIIEFEHGRWGLASSLADDWWTLETNLRRVLNAMMDIAKKRTKGMVPFGWPSRWGYLNKFRTEQSARTAIVRAIRGFLPLIGSLSMYFWYMELRGYLRDSAGEVLAVHDLPDWREAVSRLPGTSLFLELEEILDFSVPRGSFPELVDMPRDFDWIIPTIISTRLLCLASGIQSLEFRSSYGQEHGAYLLPRTHPYVAPPPTQLHHGCSSLAIPDLFISSPRAIPPVERL
ncbi:hypothetical protein B0H13DRAFT_2358260 [Mycena leptocephala]|nr:hypothetical protein B0H13DRAFT_2358260 [Mycena leptocephala]